MVHPKDCRICMVSWACADCLPWWSIHGGKHELWSLWFSIAGLPGPMFWWTLLVPSIAQTDAVWIDRSFLISWIERISWFPDVVMDQDVMVWVSFKFILVIHYLVENRVSILNDGTSRKRLSFFKTLRPRQNECHFTDDILKCIFLNENVWIPIEVSLKSVLNGPIDNIPTLV